MKIDNTFVHPLLYFYLFFIFLIFNKYIYTCIYNDIDRFEIVNMANVKFIWTSVCLFAHEILLRAGDDTTNY